MMWASFKSAEIKYLTAGPSFCPLSTMLTNKPLNGVLKTSPQTPSVTLSPPSSTNVSYDLCRLNHVARL